MKIMLDVDDDFYPGATRMNLKMSRGAAHIGITREPFELLLRQDWSQKKAHDKQMLATSLHLA